MRRSLVIVLGIVFGLTAALTVVYVLTGVVQSVESAPRLTPVSVTADTTHDPALAIASPVPTMALAGAVNVAAAAPSSTPVPAATELPTQTATPSTTPTPTIAASPTVPTITYVIVAGDTLYSIAARYGVTVDDILALNAPINPNLLQQGQQLIIPIPAAIVEATATAARLATAVMEAQTPGSHVAEDLGITLPTPTITPTMPPWPQYINGIDLFGYLLIMPDDVRANVREIYRRGRALGRDEHAFSKLGDSTIENPHFLARYDSGPYTMGDFAFLQPTIDFFRGSFARDSVAVQRGLNSWVVFDPMWARDPACPPGDGPLACEIALHNPAAIFIRLGTNDRDSAGFEANLREIIQYTLDQGVIPMLGTKADQRAGTGLNNDIVRRLADEYDVPLWDFDRVAGTLPGRGLTVDNMHLETFYSHDYSWPGAMTRGYAVHNLLALMVLDQVRQEMLAVDAADGA